MKKLMMLIFVNFLVFNKFYSQITKDNWLVGGSTSFSSLKSSSAASAQFKLINFQISPVIGYFVEDKFALGIRPSLQYGSNTVANTNTIIKAGPFVRYYFLKSENMFNLIAQSS